VVAEVVVEVEEAFKAEEVSIAIELASRVCPLIRVSGFGGRGGFQSYGPPATQLGIL
jgi:hypothetical protein